MAGIDAKLLKEARAVVRHARKLERLGWANGPGHSTRTVTVELRDEWIVFFSWLEQRSRMRMARQDGPTRLTPEEMEKRGLDSIAQEFIEPFIQKLLRARLLGEMHLVSVGEHDVLTDGPETIQNF